MEKVQRRMVKLISDKKGDSYEERLESLGLTSLEERRERGGHDRNIPHDKRIKQGR